jgi:D-xylonolactonase
MVRIVSLYMPEKFWDVEAELGEGPMWHARTRTLYFVDIKNRRIFSCSADGTQRKSWSAPQQIGFILPTAGGDLVCALEDGLYRFSTLSGRFTLIRNVEQELPSNRFNDGFVDSTGGLWFGSMNDRETQPTGSLYHLNRSGKLQVADSDYVITNGPAMSPDGSILYHTDTLKKKIYAFDVLPDFSLTNRRVFATIHVTGYPDGMAVDSDGCVWIALFGGGRIERYRPSGQLISTVPFPCSNITKLAFGGDDLCTVFVTTARKGLSPKQLANEPLAGALFSFRSAVPGLTQYEFSLEASIEQ